MRIIITNGVPYISALSAFKLNTILYISAAFSILIHSNVCFTFNNLNIHIFTENFLNQLHLLILNVCIQATCTHFDVLYLVQDVMTPTDIKSGLCWCSFISMKIIFYYVQADGYHE